MQLTTALVIVLVLQYCDLCYTIQVPIVWNDGDVQQKESKEEFSVEAFKPQNGQLKPIPVEYFEYTAKKPQFAIDIAASHGVPLPENHFKAYPVRPHTGVEVNKLGTHKLNNKDTNVLQPYQKYVQNNAPTHVIPISSNYEVFHPYKAEEPALQEIYRDPVLHKIRSDLENSKTRLQNYEREAGQPDIAKDEYLESPEKTDKKLFPQKNVPISFEIHKPQRQPVYYKALPKLNLRNNVLNQKFRHPWNQNFIKIRPVQYRSIKNHILNLRQHHAMKYDDQRNEYPQIQVSQNIAEPQEGYDIYERGKQNYIQLRNNVDESINKAVLENRPVVYQKLELQNSETKDDNEEDEFIPIKNYAQVRKTETVKHLPREAALQDADTYEEIRNAPRLREAVKSTKAQTVYTEEGYEDSAYDHAGEQKHASDHEGHAGYLKQQEESAGKYKIPSESKSYDDGKGTEYKDKVLHGQKWKNNKKTTEEKTDGEDYSEVEHSADIEVHNDKRNKDPNRNKRENENQDKNITNIDHDADKHEVNFKVPEINLNGTFLNEQEIMGIAMEKVVPQKDNLEEKYPYYFQNLKTISKDSPLRYAENFNLIPKKSKGGTEFYDSRSNFECPEVDDVDPLPDNLKNDENANDNNPKENEQSSQEKGEKNFDISKEQPRLRGLGDKIDCFKAKYFGENPLDNPFFKEELIDSPEVVILPNIKAEKLKLSKEIFPSESKINNKAETPDNLREVNKTDIFVLLNKLRSDKNKLSETFVIDNNESKQTTSLPLTLHKSNFNDTSGSNVYNDILNNIKNNQNKYVTTSYKNVSTGFDVSNENETVGNIKYDFFKNKDEVTKLPYILRKKRATPFTYEPYKIIRETQAQDSKKGSSVSNVSPLIKQMQTTRVVDRVTRANPEIETNQSSSRLYKDIGRDERAKTTDTEDSSEHSFVDINVDQRRGEPRYELRPTNHKTEYSPVENKKSISLEEYKSKSSTKKPSNVISTQRATQVRRSSRQRRPTTRPVFDVSKFLPTTTEVQDKAASNTVKMSIATTTSTPSSKIVLETSVESQESGEEIESLEEYEDYENEQESTTTTSTTTEKPVQRRRIRISTSTQNPFKDLPTQMPKLRLVTRFRNYNHDDTVNRKDKHSKEPTLNARQSENDSEGFSNPKYREKKKKSSKSTIVTDTKKYGDDDDDDVRRHEVDALIGIQHDIDDYIPQYEKEARNKHKQIEESSSDESTEDDNNYDDNEDDEDEGEEEDDEEEEVQEITTPEPTKRTLIRTTDAPKPTEASRSTSVKQKPIISKKTIEIHKELPVNRSSPHKTEFKQDIKEVEIIKEISPSPKKKQEKHKEVFNLFKDDSLATDVNKLGDVEVFKVDLDVKNGPRHGGNYRKAPNEEVESQSELRKTIKDAETSQSENAKHIELNERPNTRMHGGNLKSSNDFSRMRNSGRSAKLIELSDATEEPPREMHGSNLRLDSKARRAGRKYEKLIELDDDLRDEDSATNEDKYKAYSSRSGGAMHGANYRSAKIVQDKNINSEYDIKVKPDRVKDPRRSAAVLLNSFAQAAPILTTTPGYILDPSKRMYYYVET